ncbi:phosphoenolpyruvate carboxykinase (ATP) [Melghirimyces profundicolus]|uniref:Phosphoenolpyruvate carboxykinase (ATP) n=1 Tax=Melghirimyces profundicolus TaxID=1242148 RepID=A0A2T6BW02_9BACL|nr:phosphoenolpyruvate carboxykinase (ATP) [Melghirimyces profundicolus]PTX60245.1 phosphoenolpyruvate carboxykinase (ATP) [Melghirimyces profundicolus]
MKTHIDAQCSLDLVLEGTVYRNLSTARLVEKALERGEGHLASNGAFCATTGKFTGRSPKDKYVVEDPEIREQIDWGTVNRPMDPENFDRLFRRVRDHLRKRDVFIFDGFAGADTEYCLPIRVINELAWHNLFARQLFIRSSAEEPVVHEPRFTVVSAPSFQADPKRDGTRSETFIVISLKHRVILIGGTQYAGEMKKSVFSVMNYLLPEKGIFPMHCSANMGAGGDTALFFGLSGTGKTTLSADPARSLIGDDEHGWSDNGIFNIEGGCYAKCIGLSAEKEPQIWNAIRFGAVLENVVLDDERRPDYHDSSLTENTRAAYPVEHIPSAKVPGIGEHPEVIIFLTADAFGVLPPIAKLTPEQAMYHFLSGYTSKLAGTERGITQPEATFSACFGAPFLPRPAGVYAEMLGEKIHRHNVRVYMVNTGWSGGPYGEGERMELRYTRSMVRAALDGTLEEASFTPDPVFGIHVPDRCPEVPTEVLIPRNTWKDPEAYDAKARELARRFRKNFRRFSGVSDVIRNAGPRND